MEVKEVVFKYHRPDVFTLHLLGDTHLGTIHCAEHTLKEKVREIKDTPNCYWIGMGDYGDFITPSDPRFGYGETASWVRQDNIVEDERKKIVEFFSPIKDQCLGLIYGNHEVSLSKHKHDNVHQNICDDLKVDNIGYSCIFHFIFRRKGSSESHLIKGAFTHGTGGARTPGGKLNYLKDFMETVDANIYGYAHVHIMQMYSPDVLGTNNEMKITAQSKIGVETGCYFRTYTQGIKSSYGEQKVYKPSRIGSPKFIITPNHRLIELSTPALEW